MRRRIILLTVFLIALLCAYSLCAAEENADRYYIEVDLASQITTVYRAEDGAIVRQMICSTGTGDNTPRGSFNLEKSRDTDRKEWYYISEYSCFVKYPTRIQGHILFHSLPYAQKDMGTIDRQSVEQLGFKASHGCIRLRWQDAKWIADHCPDDTPTRIFTGTSQRAALRELLLKRSFTGANHTTYDEFIAAIADDVGDTCLSLGANGSDVAALQRRLGQLGYYNGPITGEYDSLTVAAVTRCQAAAGLLATGISSWPLLEKVMRGIAPFD